MRPVRVRAVVREGVAGEQAHRNERQRDRAALGFEEFVVGATVVAVATGTPELATTIVSALRGYEEIGLGAILGSNVFNNLLIVGVATVLTLFAVFPGEVALGLIFGLLVVAATFPRSGGSIERHRGVLLLALYVAYLVTILQVP